MRTFLLGPEALGEGSLILVNAAHPLRKQPAPASLGPALFWQPEILMDQRAASLLRQLVSSLTREDSIVAVSGYRSLNEQQSIYENAWKEHGAAFTSTYVALPNHSEHQTGLAIDLAEKREEIDFLCPKFPDTGVCGTFRRRAPRYGFIERYPKDKEHVTKIGWEPWHFRYVGFPHSRIMADLHLTLEEYIEYLKEFPWNSRPLSYHDGGISIQIGYQPCQPDGSAAVMIPEGNPFLVSGNNVDGYIVTVWKESP